ncbi:2-hydroxyacid dehydrogenase [uncultured Jatrophihabitans sp.]|uniref:2-hydroxyacid dehydrogenase n=1 Tax=uncultured Jatrophihabitans sp. TaxID=1610747 RepID=UPI0035CBD4DF
MITVSVPSNDARDLLGELPDGVRVLVWDGHRSRPGGADDIEFFVGRYDAGPPPPDVLAGLSRLKVIQLVSAGVEPWLPVVPDGVLLCNGRGVHGPSTAELAVAGMLALLRRLPAFAAAQRRHEWVDTSTESLDGLRVLVIGAGDIGARIAAAARVFGAETTMVARTARDGVHALGELPDLLPQHQVAAVAVPQTTETAGLVDAAFLAAMPDRAILVNIARGGIVDTAALLAELQAGRLRAFLDVTDPEPLPGDHPLWTAPGLVLTPHIGGGTSGSDGRAYRLVTRQITRYAAGEELENKVANGY